MKLRESVTVVAAVTMRQTRERRECLKDVCIEVLWILMLAVFCNVSGLSYHS